jgi:hypothetical protein
MTEVVREIGCSPSTAYATNSDGKITSPVMISFIDLVSAGNETTDSKQKSHSRQCQR